MSNQLELGYSHCSKQFTHICISYWGEPHTSKSNGTSVMVVVFTNKYELTNASIQVQSSRSI